jgi:hypothetical protein
VNEKIFSPETDGILKLMAIVYLMVMMFGSLLNLINGDGLEVWITFVKVSLLYLGVCAIIYILIKSQRIIMTEDKFTLKVIGLTRYQIKLKHIEQIRKGKMNGSPIMEIITNSNGRKRVLPVPFLPFKQNWDDMLQVIKDQRGEEVIGEMKLKRAKGELRTWEE